MRERSVALGLLIAGSGFVLASSGWAEAPKAAPTDAQLIASAMTAAPAKVAKRRHDRRDGGGRQDAHPAQGNERLHLHAGQPGDPRSRSDVHGQELDGVGARVGRASAAARGQGRLHVHAGGRDRRQQHGSLRGRSPTASNHWIKTGPHVMIVGADPSFYDAYPKSADPDTSVPYVMWAGTPYQHLMAPVK